MRASVVSAMLLVALVARPVEMSTWRIPEKFMGSFQLERSEKFDEFLAAKGVGWFTRQMIKLASVTKVISRGAEVDTYNLENRATKKSTNHRNWKLDETFVDDGLDGTKHEITFSFKDDELAELHKRLERPDLPPETYHYTIQEGNLVMKMHFEDITAIRYFKRINP